MTTIALADAKVINSPPQEKTVAASLYAAGVGQAREQSQLLSIDSVLVYIETRLNHLNEEINTRLAHQNSNIDLQNVLNQIKKKLTDMGITDSEHDKTNHGTPEDRADLDKLFDQAINIADQNGDTKEVEQLTSDKAIIDQGTGGKEDNDIPMEERKNVVNSISNQQENLRGRAELDMIEIQSLISQRSTSLQLATGMLANMNDTMKAIVQNVRS